MKLLRRSKFRELALALFVALAGAGAAAQPCCATASALFPARLSGEERIGVGLLVGARGDYGSLDGAGRFVNARRGDAELSFEQRVLATAAVIRQLQLSAAVPFVQTFRSAGGASEAGGGLGDVQLGVRGQAYEPGNPYHLPGLAALAVVTAPTGVAADQARKPYATDATGQGTWQLGGGLALEEWLGAHVVLELTASVLARLQRVVGAVHSQLAPQVLVGGSAAWLFDGNEVLALTVTLAREGDASINGAAVPGSGRALSTLGVFGAQPLGEGFRVQGSLAAELPVLGQGQATGVLLTAVLLKSW